MRVTVRIDELVLDGLELSRRERDALAPAVQRELGRLVALAPAAGPSRPSRVDGIARDVALAVHRSMPPIAGLGGARR
jgi:hypothetical protein